MSVSLSYFPHPHPPPPPPSPPPPPPPPPLASSLHHHHHRHHHPLLPILEHCNSIIHLKQIHARALRTASPAPNPQLFLYTRILRTATTIDLLYASRLLDHPIPPATPNSFAWNSLIRAYARSSDRKPFAIALYRRMLLDGSAPPDKHTFPFVLKACAFLAALHDGAQIHAQLAKLGFASDVYVVNSLIHFYSSCGLVTLARHLFDGMPERSVVSWNVMIDGYVEGGEYEAALALFREMLDVFEPDGFTLQSVVEACGGLGALSMVMWAHAFLLRNCDEGFTFTHNILLINNSLLDAYSKCGSIAMARQLFDRMPTRDLVSWNAMILGLAMHGRIQESLQLFTRMSTEEEGLTPNAITFIGVLNACNHGGLVVEGRRYFDLMVGEFGIEPQLEHYGCMVDLLARAGFIDEALDMVLNGMPCKPDAVIWRSLLDACCKKNAGIVVSESMARQALESEDADSSGAYVLLSRVYALANRWNDVGLVRNLMSQEGIRKQPGCSSIEMDGILHEFVAGDTSHPRSKEIYEKLQQVEQQLALVGYEPDSSEAPMVADIDGVKGDSLRHHSERLAIAFGLLCMKPGTPIRILKNLRVCRDCHTMTKLVSHVYQVEIVMRDRIRFHHFKEGLCSCMDYW